MKIAVIDCDFQSRIARFPNPFLMKVSSFYKQRGDHVVFETLDVAPADYTMIFIGRMLEASRKPPGHLLLHSNVFFLDTNTDNIEEDSLRFPNQIALARPDYNLYIFKFPTKYTEANFIQYNNYLTPIKTQSSKQHYLSNPVNIVMDQSLWRLPKDRLIETLKEIKRLKKVYFLYPISFKRLLDDDILENFLNIPLTPKLEQNFKEFSSDWEGIIKALKAIKESKKQLGYLVPEIGIVTEEHSTAKDLFEDIKRAIRIKSAANREGVHIKLSAPEDNWEPTIRLLERWSGTKKSLIDYATASVQIYEGLTAEQALSNPEVWDADTRNFAIILVRCQDLLQEIALGWQGVPNNIAALNMKRIQEEVNDIPFL